MSKRKVYIAGPMRGYPNFNFPAFFEAAELLTEQGYEVFNPAARDNERHGEDISKNNPTGSEEVAAAQHGFSLREALRDDMIWISMNADAIYLLDGWEKSKGATAEKALAEALGGKVEVMYQSVPLSSRPEQQGERDPNGLDAKVAGAKLDAGKSPVFRGVIDYFPRAVIAVGGLSYYGANKYSWKGWEQVPEGFGRYSDALGRHLTKEAIEGMYDVEILNDPKFPARILHATQVAWNAMARLELLLRDMEGKDATV